MEVEPIREMVDVKRVYKWFQDNRTIKEAECFLIGCSVALRIGDLLSLRFDQIEHGQKVVDINEQKTGKRKIIPITPTVREAVARLRKYYSTNTFYKCESKKDWFPTYLFQSTSDQLVKSHLRVVSISFIKQIVTNPNRITTNQPTLSTRQQPRGFTGVCDTGFRREIQCISKP